MWDVKVMILVDPVPHTPSRALQVLEKDTKKKNVPDREASDLIKK